MKKTIASIFYLCLIIFVSGCTESGDEPASINHDYTTWGAPQEKAPQETLRTGSDLELRVWPQAFKLEHLEIISEYAVVIIKNVSAEPYAGGEDYMLFYFDADEENWVIHHGLNPHVIRGEPAPILPGQEAVRWFLKLEQPDDLPDTDPDIFKAGFYRLRYDDYYVDFRIT
jgi:hypothetical protein